MLWRSKILSNNPISLGDILNPIKKYALLAVGTVSLGLGIVGIFLPLLPTTPFLLLTSVCFVKTSKKRHQWLMNHKTFGPYIHNYIAHKAIHKRARIIALTLLWLTISLSIYIVGAYYIKILLFIIASGVTIHLMTLKTLD